MTATTAEKIVAEVAAADLNKPAVRTAWNRRKTGVVHHEGTDIQLPGDPTEMPLKAAEEAIHRKRLEEEEIVDAHATVEGFPFDVLHAFSIALANHFGVASAVTRTTQGFFGPHVEKPNMVNVPVGHGESIQVPAGWFKAPGITGMIGIEPDFGNCRCVIQSSDMRRKHSGVIAELAKETEELLKTDSFFRGKPIHMTLAHGELNLNEPPKFLSTEGVTLEQLIFSKDLQSEIDDYLYTLIDDTENCIKDNIPLKRGYLLEGPYGVGKSLLGRYLSKKCEENGWTYILIDDATALKDALILAKRYEPAVVFCEDIDRFAAERTDSANELLNTIDGVVGKDSKVICCLTTNHIERIQKDNQAILRPGRFDVVFSVTPPDDEAVERLIRYYSDGLLDASEDITAVGAILSGQIPAVIREAVERAKLSRIRRKDSMLSAGDLVTAAKSMSKHMALLEVRADEPTDAEVLHDKLGKATAKAMNGGLADVSLQMNAVKKNVTRLVNELT